MGDIIRTWMRTRLGVIIDLSPEIFGHYARDGTLLAKLLHSYDIINDSQLGTLNRTQDPALARVNLKNLRIWLRFIGVNCDDECIEDISNGKGTTALRLFYKVFLCLENKDTLHFITLQKEREKYIPSSSKFDVTTISEEPEPWAPEDHPFAVPLKKSANLVEWHRKKYRELIEGCKKERAKFRLSQERNAAQRASAAEEPGEKTISRRSAKYLVEESEKKELDEFTKKHMIKETDKLPDSCEDIRVPSAGQAKPPRVDKEAAKAYTKSLKSKRRQEEATRSFKSRMQKSLLSELWDQVLSDQEMELDEIVARKVLHQSQYEKQLMRKLCEIKSEKTRMAGNRRIVEELLQSTRESEERLEQERAKEVLVRESEEVEAEHRRMKELERKINEETARRKLMKLRRIGEEVVEDIIDITVRSAEYKIASNDDSVPKSLLSEWKALFVKSQPIVEASESIVRPDIDEVERGEEDEDTDDEFEEEIDLARNDMLNDEDFENYNKIRSPWNDFVPDVDVEAREFLDLGLLVLGYIVHKILDSLHRYNRDPVEAPLPKMKIRAVVLGIPDSLLYEPIQELLRHSRVYLVRMEEAINHCLEQYKKEMQDVEYIDLNIIAATKESATRKSSISAFESGNKDRKKEDKSVSSRAKTRSSIQRVDQSKSGIDKLTQTPRVIPYEDMDPILTDTAYVGKWTHEFLTLGTPLSDELNARIIVEYLKSLKDVDGFVLVNYPNTYQQMTSLQYVLSGRRLPDEGKKYSTGREEMNIEDIDPVSSRISFESGGHDAIDNWRRSRLVPNPIEPTGASDGNSYITAFVRVKPKLNGSEPEDHQRSEVLSEDSTSLDAFCVDHDIASILYYKIFDLATLKRLVRLLVTGDDEYLTRISSSELFGEAVDNFAGRRRADYPSAGRAPIVKKLLSRASDYSLVESSQSEWTERSYRIDDAVLTTTDKTKDSIPRPGEHDWPWSNFPQPVQLLEALADLWRNLETSYIDNLKDMFFLKRTNFRAIIPYANFVAKHMKAYIERPDGKQDLLHEFHRAFNEIDEEIREDVEVKHELHCRVDDFQTQLWDICNLRRLEAEDEMKRIALDHWTTQESMILANVYIGIVQAEIDRYTDTMQLIQDYYLSMLQRPLQEPRRSRVLLQKIPFEMSTSGSKEKIVSAVKLSSKSVRDKDSKEVKTKISTAKILPPPSLPDENLFKDEMIKLLTDFDRDSSVPIETIACKTIGADIRYVQNLVESIASPVLDVLKKEETSSAKSTVEFRDKKGSARKVSESFKAEQEALRNRSRDLLLEWRYAVMFEINRIRLKLKILEAAARVDINFLVDKMQRVFLEIHERITDRFKREAKSVDEMASTFRFAIEEAIPIQNEMLLDGDHFLVRSNVLMFPDKPEPRQRPTREEFLPSRFQMAQLGRLVDIFRRVAPAGTLPERAFVYILQDLIVCGDEENETRPLPLSWSQLRACDVSKMIDELFGDVQFVDWREFIVHAMDIEPPSVDQILDALEAFRKFDKTFTEAISCEEFHSVGLWFFDRPSTETPSLRLVLHENFESDEEEMLGRYDPLHITLGSTRNSDETEDLKPEDAMRLTLAKELLCEMFLAEPRSVNYIALLLAFCKDENPRYGLGKALSLATGNKICVDSERGERYVKERLEKRRRAIEARTYRSSLRAEATKTAEAIVKVILKGVLSNGRLDSIEAVKEISSPNEDRRYSGRAPIRIENLDAPGETVDPADLMQPKNTPISPLSDETENDEIMEETQNVKPSLIIDPPGESDKLNQDGELHKLVYWISLDVCQSVLAAMLPRHAAQPDLFASGKNLRSNLEQTYVDIRIEELHSEAGVVLAHRFLDHEFVKKLLADTSIFTTKHLGNILETIILSNK